MTAKGFAVFTRGPGVEAAPFGPQTATGLPGLGGQVARALPDTVTSCQRVAFGAIGYSPRAVSSAPSGSAA